MPEDESNWTWNVAWWSDPVLLGHYPEEGLKRYDKYLPRITDEDMRLISEPIDVYVTENGMACHDTVSLDGKVHDPNRIDFIARYLHELKRAAEEIDLRGYFQWSLMDNFEWDKGYAERFGMVYVDFETQKRIL